MPTILPTRAKAGLSSDEPQCNGVATKFPCVTMTLQGGLDTDVKIRAGARPCAKRGDMS
jgi:hypothetical protein